MSTASEYTEDLTNFFHPECELLVSKDELFNDLSHIFAGVKKKITA